MRMPQHAPLLKQVTDILRQNILEGTWSEFMPPENALADELQVSRPTVRAALKVLQHEKLIHISHGKRTRIVKRRDSGIVLPNDIALLTSLPLHAIAGADHLVVNELRRHLQNAGYRLNLLYDARTKERSPQAILEKLTRQSKSSAWILHLQTAAVHRFFAEQGLRTLAFGSSFQDIPIPSFDVDFRSVCRHAAGHFLRKGHRRIGMVIPKTGLAGDVASERGFHEAFRLSPHADASACVITHRQTVPSLCAAIDRALNMASPPTALLVSHPADVLTVLTYLQERGTRVPGDISLISRGSTEYLEHVVPSVACYRLDWAQYARSFSHAVVQLAETGRLTKQATFAEPTFCDGDTLATVSRRTSKS